MGSREDDDYWNEKYAEASCPEHGATPEMRYSDIAGEWICGECQDEDEVTEIYYYG